MKPWILIIILVAAVVMVGCSTPETTSNETAGNDISIVPSFQKEAPVGSTIPITLTFYNYTGSNCALRFYSQYPSRPSILNGTSYTRMLVVPCDSSNKVTVRVKVIMKGPGNHIFVYGPPDAPPIRPIIITGI